jgi:hypothetical protein
MERVGFGIFYLLEGLSGEKNRPGVFPQIGCHRALRVVFEMFIFGLEHTALSS